MTRRLIRLALVLILGAYVSQRYAEHLEAEQQALLEQAMEDGRARTYEMIEPHVSRLSETLDPIDLLPLGILEGGVVLQRNCTIPPRQSPHLCAQ